MASGPRKPTPPLSAGQRRREVARLVVRLDEMLKSTAELAVRARVRVSIGGLNRYRRFAKRVRDFFALAAVAEEKLYGVPELAESPMATALDRMHARMVVLFVEGSAGFFDLYRRVGELPLGAHEMCGVELRGLREISKFLDDERYDGERGQALRRQAERVAELMLDVMDRIEPLEDFGDLPSISPKGVSRQPTKAPRREVVRAAEPPPPPEVTPPEPEWRPDDWRWMAPDPTDGSPADGPPAAAAGYGEVPAAPHADSPMMDDREPEDGEDGAWGDGEWTADGEYVDDDGRFDDAEAGEADDADGGGDDREDDGTPSPSDPGAGAGPSPREPSPLVRELTLDMVEAEERRAALNERLAARPPTSPPGRAAPPPAGRPAAPPNARPPNARPPAAPTPTPRPPVGAAPPPPPTSPGPPIKAAPFRSPTVPRPPKRG